MRLLIVGWDGATWHTLDPLIRLGAMPNLAALVRQGVRGPLKSTLPPLTGPAWTTFMTGKNPGQHGFFDWGALDSNYILRFCNLGELPDYPFWHYLDQAGWRVGVFNVPFTYPPQPLSGFWVSGLSTPGLDSSWVYPATFKERLMGILGGDYTFDLPITHYGERDHARLVDDLIDLEGRRSRALEALTEEFNPDAVALVYTGTDRIGHLISHYADLGTLTSPASADAYQASFLRYYRWLDEELGRTIEQLSPGGHIIMVSDHGFTAQKKVFVVNEWLHQKGYLALDWFGHIQGVVTRWLSRLGSSAQRSPAQGTFDTRFFLGRTIDWRRTRAFCNALNGIYLNAKGRFSQGIVEPGADYQALRARLRDELLALRDPETGELILEEVVVREDAFSGANAHLAPDLMLRFVGDCYIGDRYFFAPQSNRDRVGRSPFRWPAPWGGGSHHRDGIVLFNGPAFRADTEVSDATIEDVAPTILHLAGLPVPSGMSGHVLEEAFTADYRKAHPVAQSDDPAVRPDRQDLSPDEEQLVYERLRDLGYLD